VCVCVCVCRVCVPLKRSQFSSLDMVWCVVCDITLCVCVCVCLFVFLCGCVYIYTNALWVELSAPSPYVHIY